MANNIDFKLKNAVEVGGPTKVTLGSITSSDIDLSTGNYFADTLAANTTYTLSNAGDVQSFQLEVTGGAGSGYNLANADYDSVSFDLSSQDSNPNGVIFNNDGTKMYMIGADTDAIYQYSLSTAYNISTASYDSVSFSVSSQDTRPRQIALNSDGTKMYMIGSLVDRVHQYSLSTAYDLSTISYDSVYFSVGAQEDDAFGLVFKPDGTKMYIVGFASDAAYQYSLSTAYDLSTASYDSVSLSVSGQDATSTDLCFNDDGTTMYVLGIANDSVYQYSLSTAYDLSTASYDSVSFNVGGEAAGAFSVRFNDSGTKMYITSSTNAEIYQYSTATPATLTWPSSIEWAGGVAPSAPATGETDVFTFVTDDGGTSYVGVKTADNLS